MGTIELERKIRADKRSRWHSELTYAGAEAFGNTNSGYDQNLDRDIATQEWRL